MLNITHFPKNCASFKELESQSKIHTGQGEYIVFHNTEKKGLSREAFELVYQVLTHYTPAAIINRGSAPALEECSHRFAIIKSRVKEIDPTLEVVFIPRTLYELVFIRKCIREDLKYEKICHIVRGTQSDSEKLKSLKRKDFWDQKTYERSLNKYIEKQKIQRKCWHIRGFSDAGNNDHPGVKDIAYRLNQTITKNFSPPADGFTFQELSQFAEKEIAFLKDHLKKGNEKSFMKIFNSSTPGPTINFACNFAKGLIKPMGIRKHDARIIRKAIALECSTLAERAFLLYRGADFQKDSPCMSEMPYSLSYGSSVFAGCIFDGGATAFHYMRNEKNAYAISVPFDQLNISPFYIPPTGCIPQLFGKGEDFHARTKAWTEGDSNGINGMSGFMGYLSDEVRSNLSKEEFITQFEHYKKEAIQLK